VIQQVNLYQPMFRKRRRIFTATAMVQSVILAVIGFGVIYAYGAWQVRQLATEVGALQRDRDLAAARLVTLQRQLPKRQPSKVLAGEVARLVVVLQGRRQLVESLSSRVTGSAGMSPYLAGLARQHVVGLWLTGLRVAKGGKELQVRGSALDPALVPRLVRRLSAESEFRGRKFRTFTIERPESDPKRVDFLLQTDVEAEAAK